MSNTEAVDRYLASITVWASESGATTEQIKIAQVILVLGGSRALIASERIMGCTMRPDDWKEMYDAYQEVTRLIGAEMLSAQAPVIEAPETTGIEGWPGAGS